MEDELLKELDSILQPAISRSWQSAKRMSRGGDPSDAFLDMFKIEIDNTKVDLSKSLYKLDLAMQGCSTAAEADANEFMESYGLGEELPKVDEADYVRQANGGFEVWDGLRWVQLSDKSNIKIEIFQNPENDNRPAVRVWAQDSETKTSVVFIDNDVDAPGWDVGYTHNGDGFDSEVEFAALQRGGYYENPFYNITKNIIGVGGTFMGLLEIRHVGNLTPWRSGSAIKNADGWYRNAEGIYENLSKQRGRGAGGYQKSTKRALGKAKVFKGAGKVFLGASIVLSATDGVSAYVNQDTNRREVAIKATFDIAIGVIGAVGGPVGWVIAGTYFILDVSGAFGDWGQPSGISQDDYNEFLRKKIQQESGDYINSLKFEVDFVAPLEKSQNNFNIKERSIQIDNTKVALPKIIFFKN